MIFGGRSVLLPSHYIIGDLSGHSLMEKKIPLWLHCLLQIHFTLILIFISFNFFSSISLTPSNASFKGSIVLLWESYYVSFPTQLPTNHPFNSFSLYLHYCTFQMQYDL
jgi:hypothetical protein